MIALIAAYALVLIMFALLLLTLFAFNKITRARKFSEKELIDLLENRGACKWEKCSGLCKRDIAIISKDGLRLEGIYIEGDKAVNRVMIFVHGYLVSSTWSFHFIDEFLKNGWGILLIDQRRHGKSEGRYATYGYLEKYDLDLWVDWVIGNVGRDIVIGLHGQSMGGATVLEYSAINRHARFIVADCPYSDMSELIKYQMHSLRFIPTYPLIFLVDLMLSIRAGFRMRDVSPIRTVCSSDIPIMFIHGGSDRFVPTYMSKDLYKAKRGPKKLLIVPEARHGYSCIENRELYMSEMFNFIEEAIGTI